VAPYFAMSSAARDMQRGSYRSYLVRQCTVTSENSVLIMCGLFCYISVELHLIIVKIACLSVSHS